VQLECSEELGDLVKTQDPVLALSVYLRANVPAKVIVAFAEAGQYQNIIVYAKRVGFQPDYVFLLNNILRANPPAASAFARDLLMEEAGPLAEPNQIVDAFVSRGLIQDATSLLLDYLKPNLPEHADLQTRLLEINLTPATAKVADLIMEKQLVTHYDRTRVAMLCEKCGLGHRALELFTDINDVKRVIVSQGPLMVPDVLFKFFGTLSADQSLDVLKELLAKRDRPSLQIAVGVAQTYSDALTPAALVALFESFNSWEGLYFYLNQIVWTSEDGDVVFKFIQAASKTNHFEEVKRVCRENNAYDAVKVKDYLKEAKLADQIPLIIVCDRFDFVDELTHYLYKNNMLPKVEVYVQKVNPLRTPIVVGALLDDDCDEAFIKNLIMSVRNMVPIEDLVDQVEKRNRIKILQPFLEARVAEGIQDPAAHNALAKIYIDTNAEPEHFLQTNQFYDSVVVGKYCEKRDPHLAFIAYKRGNCDRELVDVTNKSQMFKQQARYLVERQSPELWQMVLDVDNKFRRSVIDQVVSTALPECKSADEVSASVKAFMTAGLPNELIELLEKIVLEGHDFSGNKNLQNLLILTAIKVRTRFFGA
jgi:clathrin heavy chain